MIADNFQYLDLFGEHQKRGTYDHWVAIAFMHITEERALRDRILVDGLSDKETKQRTTRKKWMEIQDREEFFKRTMDDHDRLSSLMHLHVQVTLACKMWRIPVATLQEMDKKGDYSFQFDDDDEKQLPPLLHRIFNPDDWEADENDDDGNVGNDCVASLASIWKKHNIKASYPLHIPFALNETIIELLAKC